MFLPFILFCLPICTLLSSETSDTYTIQAIDPKGYYLRLDNGSIWEVDWINSWNSYNWNNGERVVITEHAAGHYLINLDQRAGSSRISGKPCPNREQDPYRHFIAEVEEDGSALLLENGSRWQVTTRRGIFKWGSLTVYVYGFADLLEDQSEYREEARKLEGRR